MQSVKLVQLLNFSTFLCLYFQKLHNIRIFLWILHIQFEDAQITSGSLFAFPNVNSDISSHLNCKCKVSGRKLNRKLAKIVTTVNLLLLIALLEKKKRLTTSFCSRLPIYLLEIIIINQRWHLKIKKYILQVLTISYC